MIGMACRARLGRVTRMEAALRGPHRRDLAMTGEAATIHACATRALLMALEALRRAIERGMRSGQRARGHLRARALDADAERQAHEQ
mgnify:CR=1 FL=1